MQESLNLFVSSASKPKADSDSQVGLVVANGLEEVERYLHYSCEGLIDGKQLIGEVFIKKNQSLEDAKEMLRDLLLCLVWV